ncbi:MAG TPA: FAD-binding domain-containing protein, partial [Bacteroidales bacterium]|nr:FAD-binding domain-containing protein [Bacteroidales bacterium]
DYEQASNVGNWQWAAGSGCDAVPYFRIFNPELQRKKFDPIGNYVKQWNVKTHTTPLVEHEFARRRCLETYKKALYGSQ